jgi:hypothetical protein
MATGNFKYVFIPAEDSEPISTLEASKAGGLQDDELAKSAKAYFFETNGGAAQAKQFDNASPEEKKALAQQIRSQYAGDANAASQLMKMDDDALLQIVKSSQATPNCEITALTVPTPKNGQEAVSMYGDDNGRTRNLPFNARATALMGACGHALPPVADNDDGKESGVYGDVFVGRCIDDEIKDIWERIDLTEDDVQGNLDNIEWIRTALKQGGGGGHGGSSAASMSSVMNQMANGKSGGVAGMNTEQNENGFTWSQTEEEVEIKFVVASGVKAKYVKVKFGRGTLKVTVTGQTLCDGDTCGDVVVDDSTYTIQDSSGSSNGERELCITLGKKKSGQWNYAIRGK